MSLIHNATFDSQTRVLSLLDKAGDVISSCEVPSKELVDDPNKPLMLRAIEDNSSVSLEKAGTLSNTYQTSTNGEDWTDYTLGTQIILNKGGSVYFRCSNHPTTQTPYAYVYFKMTGKIEAWHNAYSMISSDFSSAEGEVGDFGMNGLFEHCSSLTKAPLLLNALSYYCYIGTFLDCNSLTQAPALPATILETRCYQSMFSNCKSLTKAPALPAMTLASSCYQRMFSNCSNLKEVRISATTTATDSLKDWLKDVSATGNFYCDPNATIFPTDSASGIPSGWTRVDVDDPNKPLMLRAIENNSSVSLGKHGTLSNTYQTSTDGTNWTDYTLGTKINLNKGESVYFRCNNHPTTQATYDYVRFNMWGKIEAWHNAYSMISSSFTDTSASVGSYGLYLLFQYCEVLTKAPLLLNALSPHCYDGLFYGCIALKQAPSLPATTLVDSCYYDMFSGCQSLKEVRISATTTAWNALFNWLRNVSATGDFYCDPNATIFPTGTSGIPANWNRHALSDYPATP